MKHISFALLFLLIIGLVSNLKVSAQELSLVSSYSISKPIEKYGVEKSIQNYNFPLLEKSQSTNETPTGLDYYSQMSYWCSFYGCNPDTLYRVMWCESKGNPLAYNRSGASGLMQFMPKTFNAYSKKAGIPNGNIWNVEHQIRTSAYMFSIGGKTHWSCP